MRRLTAIASLILTSLFSVPLATAADAPAPGQKAVLITGASSGIGRKITEHLAGRGYFIYAGARKDSEMKELGAIKNVQSVRLDVTKAEDIAAAVDMVKKGGRGLYGLINNAGVVTIGSVLDTNEKEFDLVMDVNVYGPYRITKAFAPLIIEQKGRIVTIGSIAGVGGGKNFSAYTMSKHAMEGFTDSLALEMEPLGVQVSVIEPGGFKSKIFESAAERGGAPASITAATSKLKEPDDVAYAAELALFEPTPKRRYMVTPNEGEAARTLEQLMQQLVQLNEGQPYTYDRDTLVKMLDKALAGSRPRTEPRSAR